MDRPRGDESVSRPVLDARPDRRHQGVPPRRAVRRRAGARRRGAGGRCGPGVPQPGGGCGRNRTHHDSGSIFFAVQGQGAFVLADEPGTDATPSPVRVSDRDDPASVRFCESVESGHSAHGDAAAIAGRLGMTAPPLAHG